MSPFTVWRLDALDALQDADPTADASRLFGFYDGVVRPETKQAAGSALELHFINVRRAATDVELEGERKGRRGPGKYNLLYPATPQARAVGSGAERLSM